MSQKETRVIRDPRAVKQDQINMLFSGTTVVNGHAKAHGSSDRKVDSHRRHSSKHRIADLGAYATEGKAQRFWRHACKSDHGYLHSGLAYQHQTLQ